ncbi:ABC transporter ATP-binding protein [Putridiphycobacter roseus]|uniref:ABC transporter ATP-binding protein n=2 Tax=Putridiphycobacter roseus TaxID=2219161 RepID=A0A2W1NJE7_9FLAO|nr:ABC transporter ATP-binding protein [Putridiphycobacter roseus]
MDFDSLKMNPVKRFWLLLKPDQSEIRNVYVYAFFQGMVYLSLPLGIQAIINLIQGGDINTSWVVLVSFVIGGLIINGVLQISQLKITENLQQKIFTRAAFEFAYRMPRIKLEALYQYYAPELMNRFFDVVSVQKGLSKILIEFSTASIQVIFGLILLSLYHPFFIAFSLILVVLAYVIFKLTARVGLETSLAESKHKYFVAHWLEELARTMVSFKLAGNTNLPLERMDTTLEKYIDARESHFKVLVYQYKLMIIFKVIITAGLLIIGSILVMEQQMNIGQFVAAEIIILLVLNSVEKLILSLETIYDVLTSLEKIGQVTDMPLENEAGTDLSMLEVTAGLKVELNAVSFTYPTMQVAVIDDLSITFEAGSSNLLLGDSDSGKSTLMYLISGLYCPKGGYVSYQDLPQGNLNLPALRSLIGDCLREELLFEGTLLENVSMGRKAATFENVQWAMRNMGLDEFVKQLPQGYNTVIQSEGQRFSKGIVDKILLARSIADKPKLLLIKDAFASISPVERDRIIRFLTDAERQWTLVIASSNKYIASYFDYTALLKNGKVEKIDTFKNIKPFLNL